jgi:drug/metabolite transporter (DMT)-like permease
MPKWLLFLGPCVIWGSTWFVIKFQLGVVAPEASIAYRFGLASVLLFTWCAARGLPLRLRARTHADLALVGLFQYGVAYVLVYVSEGRLTSGVVAVIFSLIVVWNLAGSRIFFGRAVPRPVAIGACLGLLGVALVFWRDVSAIAGASRAGVVVAIAGTFASSAGNLVSERVYARGDVGVVPSTAFAMLYGAAAVALYAVARGVRFTIDPSPAYLGSLAYLSVFGSVLAFVGFLELLRRVGAGRAGYMSVVIPVFAMTLSTLFERYRWSALTQTGIGLVLLGNGMVLWGRARPAKTPAHSPGLPSGTTAR